MKTIINTFLLIILVNISFAGSFEVNIKNHDRSDINETLDYLMEDLEFFLDKPLNWCNIKPTSDVSIIYKREIKSRIKMGFEIKCDHNEARKEFKKFWKKYDSFLQKHTSLVDQRMEIKYPDFKLKWGMAINDYMFIQLYNKKSFGGSHTFYNKCVFFTLDFNDGEYESETLRINMPGNTLTIIPTNTIPDRTHYVYYFNLDVPTKILEDDEVDIDINRVWHLVNHQSYIKGSQY